MADALPPEITVQSPRREPNAKSAGQMSEGLNESKGSKTKTSTSIESRPPQNATSFPHKLIRTLSNNHANTASSAPSGIEGRRDPQTDADPLSQRIFERTHTEKAVSQKMHSGPSDEQEHETFDNAALNAPSWSSTDPTITRADGSLSTVKEKKNRVSFLSRLIGSKKKETTAEIADDESDVGDTRAEGTDADIFLQPIGFVPKFPAPPKYIKVRSRGKKEKDFNRLFLAQELRGRTGVEIAQEGGRSLKGGPVRSVEKAKNDRAVWAMEFSEDGRYLAAGGYGNIVRVWGVLVTEEDRQMHEKEEDVSNKDGAPTRLSAPVFKTKPVHEYEGHTGIVLDLSWSKNNFLLSSAMDKTVRLWHTTRKECLCCFKHGDFVTSIQFHPRDDRFFLAGSMDSKLRLWSIPDKNVAFWSQLSEIITSVAFSPDGKMAIAGCLSGQCQFFETEGLKYQTQMHVRSAHGKNARGSKVTGIQAINYPPSDINGEVKLLVTTNDSRVRVYNLRDKGLDLKLKGNENASSQIRATFSDDARYVICGSEDKKVYIWSTGPPEKDKEKSPVEMFEAHSATVTTAIMAPTKTRQLLQFSGDPLYNLCNPPPVTLLSRSESQSSRPATENGHNLDSSVPPTPLTADFSAKTAKLEESPAYIARSTHMDGNIIVTADYIGRIKVFRQDCAYEKRLRADNMDNSSKKMLNRNSSIATRHSRSSQRNSSSYPSSDRILSWRQSIERGNGSHEQVSLQTPIRNGFPRSISPRKSLGGRPSKQQSHQISTSSNTPSASLKTTSNPPSVHKASAESPYHLTETVVTNSQDTDPLMLEGTQSLMFWNKATYAEQAASSAQRRHTQDFDGNSRGGSLDTDMRGSVDGANGLLRPGRGGIGRNGSSGGMSTESRVSALSSDLSSEGGLGADKGEEEIRCKNCGGESFRARIAAKGERKLECTQCGTLG